MQLPVDYETTRFAFLQRWTKQRPGHRHYGVELFSALWPNLQLIRDAESMLEALRYAGKRGEDYRSGDVRDFAKQLPRSHLQTVNVSRAFKLLAFRQWQIGRGWLVRSLLRQHRTQRARERCGLAP